MKKTLTERLRFVAIGVIKEAEGQETKSNIDKMHKIVKNLYYKADKEGKAKMREDWDEIGI